MSYVYILKSLKNNKRYVGVTSHTPKERLKQHNAGGNKWTKGNRPFRLIYSEEYASRLEASRREKYLKSGQGRKLLDRIIPR